MAANASWRSAYAAAASRIGVSLGVYIEHREAGERWCSRCRAWHAEEVFRSDAKRGVQRVCRPGPWRVG
jgi:hypothetical protein